MGVEISVLERRVTMVVLISERTFRACRMLFDATTCGSVSGDGLGISLVRFILYQPEKKGMWLNNSVNRGPCLLWLSTVPALIGLTSCRTKKRTGTLE